MAEIFSSDDETVEEERLSVPDSSINDDNSSTMNIRGPLYESKQRLTEAMPTCSSSLIVQNPSSLRVPSQHTRYSTIKYSQFSHCNKTLYYM